MNYYEMIQYMKDNNNALPYEIVNTITGNNFIKLIYDKFITAINNAKVEVIPVEQEDFIDYQIINEKIFPNPREFLKLFYHSNENIFYIYLEETDEYFIFKVNKS